MNLTWTCAILSLFVFATALSDDQLNSFIQLTKYGYEDSCLKSAQLEWIFVNEPTNETYQSWKNATCEYALHKIKQANETSEKKVETLHNPILEYTYNVVIKPGDALLPTEDFNELVSFAGRAALSRLTGYYVAGGKKLSRQDAERQLTRYGAARDKLSAWSAWHRALSPMAANFSHSLQLIEKAARANGKSNVREYWEMLSGYENGYDRAKHEWSKISAVHNKILGFVKNRLSLRYGDEIENDTLSAHLLGSLGGYDWTNLVMDVAPYSEVTFGVTKKMWEKKIVGENLYKEASRLGHILLKHMPQANFWKESNFRGQCPSRLINLCKEGEMRISTCSEASIANFISAHKNVAKILSTQMSHGAEPILNAANRFSALEEGVAELFGILSVSQAWLHTRGLIDNTTDLDQVQIVSLMITALDVLPRMAYYLAADAWRIDATTNRTYDEKNLTSTWWKYRMEYEGINTSVSGLPTFLDDDYVTSNRPYLPKFLGAILGFQIYEYLMDSTEMRYETIQSTPANHHLAKMIRQDFADDWTLVMRRSLSIDEVNADALLSYFSTLIDYIDEQVELNENFPIAEQREKELDVVADKYRKIFDAPSTTTTTTTTTTTVATKASTTSRPIEIAPKTEKKIATKNNDHRVEATKLMVPVDKLKNSTISRDVEIPPVNETKEMPIATDTVQSEEAEKNDEIPKPNTSKAVWAVAAVLTATIIICIIAIFGRRRCRKVPKNRRYV